MANSQPPIQSLPRLYQGLDAVASSERYLFTPSDMRALLPSISDQAYKTLLSRAASAGRLERVCRGLYLYGPARPATGSLLFHAAARLRAHEFNYISLETVLSDCGIISQVPQSWITIMSSGRSNVIDCGRWGSIEFVHTRQKAAAIADQLVYDSQCGMWRASPAQAMRDMRVAKRSLELVDWEVVNELV
jgi:predicted transcriptional regulator of viral defense system